MTPDHGGEVPTLIPNWHVAVRLAPLPYLLHGACKPILGGELTHNPASLPGLSPDVGEAEEVEPVLRVMPTCLWSEVNVPRLGRV